MTPDRQRIRSSPRTMNSTLPTPGLFAYSCTPDPGAELLCLPGQREFPHRRRVRADAGLEGLPGHPQGRPIHRHAGHRRAPALFDAGEAQVIQTRGL